MSGPSFSRPDAEAIRAWVLSVVGDLKMRPESAGPYFIVDELAKASRLQVHPSQVEGLFDAIFKHLGGWAELEEWRRRTIRHEATELSVVEVARLRLDRNYVGMAAKATASAIADSKRPRGCPKDAFEAGWGAALDALIERFLGK